MRLFWTYYTNFNVGENISKKLKESGFEIVTFDRSQFDIYIKMPNKRKATIEKVESIVGKYWYDVTKVNAHPNLSELF